MSRTGQAVALFWGELERPHSRGVIRTPSAGRAGECGQWRLGGCGIRSWPAPGFFDALVLDALSAEVHQIVICGAGYDDRALRLASPATAWWWFGASDLGVLLPLVERQYSRWGLFDLEANGEAVPEALADRTYSGQFVVRVPPEVHRQLVLDAAEQHVSLNRLISSRLAS